jgi:AcrR family transcriptional regulator
MSKKLEILKAASHLFGAKGFKETSMTEVAQITGTAGSTVFYHYKTKEEILLAILKQAREELIAEIDRHLAENGYVNGLDMVQGLAGFYLSLSGARPDTFSILHHRFPHELAAVNPVCREHLEAIYNCFIDVFEKAVRTGHDDGSILPTPARKTAMIVFAMIDGLVRFNTSSLYDAGSLYEELIESCRRMLQANPSVK